MNRFQQQCIYEAEGASAAREGLKRENCPYDDQNSEAWNFWVYGNENEQGRLVEDFMKQEGSWSSFYFSTGEITPETEKLWAEWHGDYLDANKRMREQKGWKP